MPSEMDPRARAHLSVCADCGDVLTEPADLPPVERKPCPSCGSLNRALARVAEDHVAVDDEASGTKA